LNSKVRVRTPSGPRVSIDDTDNKTGLSFGAGIIIGQNKNTRVEIFPLYNTVFTEEESTKYLSLNLGIIFK